jgi:hypothetical protein
MRSSTSILIALPGLVACAALAGCAQSGSTSEQEHRVTIVAKSVGNKVCPLRVEPPPGSCYGDPTAGPEDVCVYPGDHVRFQLADENKANWARRFRLGFQGKSPLGWQYGTVFGCSTSSSKGNLRCKVRGVNGRFDYAVSVDEGCDVDPRIVVNPKRRNRELPTAGPMEP